MARAPAYALCISDVISNDNFDVPVFDKIIKVASFSFILRELNMYLQHMK